MGEGLRSVAEMKQALQAEQTQRTLQMEELQSTLMAELQKKENILTRQILEIRDHTKEYSQAQIANLRCEMMARFDQLQSLLQQGNPGESASTTSYQPRSQESQGQTSTNNSQPCLQAGILGQAPTNLPADNENLAMYGRQPPGLLDYCAGLTTNKGVDAPLKHLVATSDSRNQLYPGNPRPPSATLQNASTKVRPDLHSKPPALAQPLFPEVQVNNAADSVFQGEANVSNGSNEANGLSLIQDIQREQSTKSLVP